MRAFLDFLKDETGATSIEYALVASGVAMAIILAVNSLGSALSTKFEAISGEIK